MSPIRIQSSRTNFEQQLSCRVTRVGISRHYPLVLVSRCFNSRTGLTAAIAIALSALVLFACAVSARADVVVSLGDSYSSGEGTKRYDSDTEISKDGNGCHRGPRAWPRLMGVSKSNHLACSGAVTDDFYSGQKAKGPDKEGQLVRLERIAAKAPIDTVVVTIGGNDMKFADTIVSCYLRSNQCVESENQFRARVAKVGGYVTDALRKVIERSGATRVVLVGYPDIFSPPGGPKCGWMSSAEHQFLWDAQGMLDDGLYAAATNAGAEYVFNRGALASHYLCAKDSWVVPPDGWTKVKGIVFETDRRRAQEMAHPTPRGQQAIADIVGKQLREIVAQCKPAASLELIVDDSGSMSGNDSLNIRRQAIELLLSKPSSASKVVGATEFGTNAGPLFAPAVVSAARPAMTAALSAIANDGVDGESSTDYNAAFGAAKTQMPDAGARIFLTDGRHEEGNYDDGHAGGPPTYAIGLNIGRSGQGDAPADLLARIANETGGKYYPLKRTSADTAQAQLARLQRVVNEIASRVDCTNLPTTTTRTLTTQKRTSSPLKYSFAGAKGFEIVTSWPNPAIDVDLTKIYVRDAKGRVIADMNGRKRIKRSKKRRTKLTVSLFEGGAFDTMVVTRPPRGAKLVLSVKAPKGTGLLPVSVQVRPVDDLSVAPGGGPAQPQPAPANPGKLITVDNRVTNGMSMREDSQPVRLLTKAWILCGSRGCNINGTERWSGGTYEWAVCQVQGERTTNGNDSSAADDANPDLAQSTLYYGVRLANGTFGYVNEIWIRRADRGGLGLPAC